MPTALAQQARRTTSTITTAVTQQSATQRSLESANRNLFSLTAASQTSVTLFHISKTVCAQSFFIDVVRSFRQMKRQPEIAALRNWIMDARLQSSSSVKRFAPYVKSED